MTPPTEHVRLLPPGTLWCRRCEKKRALQLPLPIQVMLQMLDQFELEHAKCEAREVTS